MAETDLIPIIISAVIPILEESALEISSSSSDSEDELDMRIQQVLRKEKEHRTKIGNYFETVVPQYLDDDFRAHFRLTRTSVQELLEQLMAKKTLGLQPKRRPKIQYEKALHIFLWIMSNQESFRGVSDRFGIGKGHAHRVFIEMCEDVSALAPDLIKWPSGNELLQRAQEFEDLQDTPGFPGVIGCIDTTHIEIPGPSGDNSFYNRNKYHSIILQGVCDASGAFTDVYVGWPGSVHDARVWQHSPLYEKLETGILPENLHILGDSAYPLKTFLMTVFKDNGFLTQKQKKYNKLLSSKRVAIENAFGRLKQLFRRLKYLDMVLCNKRKFVVIAACVCHNIVTWQRNFNEDVEVDEGLAVMQFGEDVNVENTAAKRKRNAIADMLFN